MFSAMKFLAIMVVSAASLKQDPCAGCTTGLAQAYQTCASKHGNPCAETNAAGLVSSGPGTKKDVGCCMKKEKHDRCLQCASMDCAHGTCKVNKKYYNTYTIGDAKLDDKKAMKNAGSAQASAQLQAALEDANTALALKPRYAKALFRRGLVQLDLEHYREAESDFNMVAEVAPGFVGLAEHRCRAKHWAQSPPVRNYYALLGVPFDVGEADLKRAYKAAALRWHPDKNPNSEAEATATAKTSGFLDGGEP